MYTHLPLVNSAIDTTLHLAVRWLVSACLPVYVVIGRMKVRGRMLRSVRIVEEAHCRRCEPPTSQLYLTTICGSGSKYYK